ncbi:hypothetical protein [Methylobacter sp.]|uniref:tetratricopeptide repeat protein n=1 Tax=Methylobacter sp. TaxID=2051955 RepID=UPI003DA35FBE
MKFLSFCLISVLVGFSVKAQAGKEPIRLFDNLGEYYYPISTSSPLAQRYFDQGLILSYGFNHAEAARSFHQAYRLDPDCAICYWGEALVLGPNINAPMDPSAALRAYKSAQKALELAPSKPDKEQSLIRALFKRYAMEVYPDRTALDRAYASAMRNVAARFPDDAVIAALCAESLMDLHPWDFWTRQGEPRPWTAEIVSILEHALEIDIYNPLANHLYIHAMEASPYAEKAIASAERLPSLVPDSGHLAHMPSHIYIRVGRYRDAIAANRQAVGIDHDYLSDAHAESIYTFAYVPHNYHFLWAAAIKTGQKALASKAAADTASRVNRSMMREPGFSGTLQHFYTIPLYTKAMFGEWDAILSEPAPAADLIYVNGVWHYVCGLALLRQGRDDESLRELESLQALIADPAAAKLTIFDINSVAQLLQIGAAILHGELAAKNKDYAAAIAHLQKAVKLEGELNYIEPKDWYLPSRQVLGAVLLEAGKAGEAGQVYRQDLIDHPQNGWSLFGLAQSLRRQGKTKEADDVERQFKHVWADADVTLTSSRF